METRPRRSAALVVALCLLLLAGCRPGGPAPRSGAATLTASRTPRVAVASATVQRSPEYQHAAALYAAGDYRGALAAVDALAGKPELTAPDRDFLSRQRAICTAALQGRPQGARSAPPQPANLKPQASPPLGDCGPRALAIVARSFGLHPDTEALTKIAGTTVHGTNLEGLTRAAKSIGLEAEGVQVDRAALKQLDTPAIAWVDGDHFLAVLKVNEDEASVHDPNRAHEEVIPTEEVLRRSGGVLLKLRPAPLARHGRLAGGEGAVARDEDSTK